MNYDATIILNTLTTEPQDAKALAAKWGCTVKTARSWLKKARDTGIISSDNMTKSGGTMVYVGITHKPVASKRTYSTHKRTKADIIEVVRERQTKHQRRMDAATTVWDIKRHRTRYQRATKRLEALAV